MVFSSVLVILALLILVALFVARPLIQGEKIDWQGDPESSHWLAERERVLEALQELDFDHDLEKVPEGIYTEQRARLLGQGAEALKKLDAIDGRQAEKEVEKTLKGRKKTGKSDDLEALINAHKAKKRQ